MRYRNRIKLAPGINLNLSRSGISGTFGPQGASINLNRDGAYLNTGIPGTGLYDRTKLSSSKNHETANIGNSQTRVGVKLDLNENYEPIIEIYDNKGNNITNPTIINKIKRTTEYKENLQKIYKLNYDQIIQETNDYTELHKHIIKPITKTEIEESLKNLKPDIYIKKEFSKIKPTSETIKTELLREAKIIFNSLLFWNNPKKRNTYVNDNFDSRFKILIETWENEKEDFEKSEQTAEIKINSDNQEFYELKKQNLINNSNGISDFVIPNFETILKEIDIKPEFFIDFEYNEENKTFLLDLDLPEIENIPEKTASILQSGKLSVKTKSEKQIKEDYAKCVTGLGFLISGITFMASVGIEKVIISAYTQRINNANGLEKDDYIYSVEFDRETFSKINYSKFEPIEAFKNFKYEMDLSKSHIFKTIILTPN